MTKEVNELWKKDDDLYYAEGAIKPFTGLHKMYHDNGQPRLEAPFIKGEKDGLEKQWHESGQKLLEVQYKNNKAEGLYTYYYKNGQKQVEGMYQDDKQEGLWSYYDENGKKNSKYDVFERGELVERDGSKISYFSNLINLYEETYNLKLQNYYEGFQPENYSYDKAAESCNYPTNTIIVDNGDVSYLVLRPNKDPIKLDPFFDVSEDSIDSSYEGPHIIIPFSYVPDEGLPMVRFLPGVDDFDYPSIDNPRSFNDGYDQAYELYKIAFTTNESAFKDLDLDAEKNYILGRKLIISVLRMSDGIDALANEDLVDDDGNKMSLDDKLGSFIKLFTPMVSENIQEIYEWAASDDEEYDE